MSSCLEELRQLAAKRREELEESRQLWAFFQVGGVNRLRHIRIFYIQKSLIEQTQETFLQVKRLFTGCPRGLQKYYKLINQFSENEGY